GGGPRRRRPRGGGRGAGPGARVAPASARPAADRRPLRRRGGRRPRAARPRHRRRAALRRGGRRAPAVRRTAPPAGALRAHPRRGAPSRGALAQLAALLLLQFFAELAVLVDRRARREVLQLEEAPDLDLLFVVEG